MPNIVGVYSVMMNIFIIIYGCQMNDKIYEIEIIMMLEKKWK